MIDGGKLTRSASTQINARNLMNPDEIMRMRLTDQLLMLQGPSSADRGKDPILRSARVCWLGRSQRRPILL